MTTIHAASAIVVSKYLASVGRESATGRLESCTSMYAAVRARSTSRRCLVAISGLTTLNMFRDPPPSIADQTRGTGTGTDTGVFHTIYHRPRVAPD